MSFEEDLGRFLRRADSAPAPRMPSAAEFVATARRGLAIRRAVAATAAIAAVTAVILGTGYLTSERRQSPTPPVDSPSPAPTATKGEAARCPDAPPVSTGDDGFVAYKRDGDLRVADVTSGEDRELVAGAVRGEPPHVRVSPDGRWVAYGPGRLAPAAGGRSCAPAGDVFDLEWSPAENVFAGITRRGGVVIARPDGTRHVALPDGWGATSVAWSPDGERIAVGRFARRGSQLRAEAGVYVIDIRAGQTSAVVEYAPDEGIAPEIAAWAPDGAWILFFETFGFSASISADGGRLVAVAAAGGAPVEVAPMLATRDFLDWCGDDLVVAMGGWRDVTSGKRVALASPPEWEPRPLRPGSEESEYWPSCSPDGGSVAVTVTEDRGGESRFGVQPRTIDFFPLSHPDQPGGFSLGSLSAEYPLWSDNAPREVTILFVGRERASQGPAAIYLQDGKRTQHIADLGGVGSYYGHYSYAEIFDWYQP
ncbi:MAG: hypothetical protein ACRDKB_00135 [Actinomycetota bacterium]